MVGVVGLVRCGSGSLVELSCSVVVLCCVVLALLSGRVARGVFPVTFDTRRWCEPF